MSVHKDKRSKSWYVKHNNKTKRGFSSKKLAQEYEATLLNGNVVPEIIKKNKFKDVAQDYLLDKKKEVSYSSYVLYEQYIKRIIIPTVGDTYIEDITELDCKKFRNSIYELHYSTARKNCILNHYKNVFIHAIRYYGLKNNPSLLVLPFRLNQSEKIKKKNKGYNIWTYADFNKFINCVDDEEYKLLYITLFLTGMRLGEALALNWNDLGSHIISITKSQCKKAEEGKYIIKEPKNVQSIRDISINDSLYRYLLWMKAKKMKKKDFNSSWFIFGDKEPLPRTTIERIKNKACRESGVKRIRLHDFRHSHASNLIGDGVDIVAVSKRLGHSDVYMTLKVYTHLLDKNDDKLVAKIEESSQNLLKIFSLGDFNTKNDVKS